jgi:tRNA G18 (ribose-2'-O)-methylase SpoU
MYNDRMPTTSYEIRVCNSCGLRYPLVEGDPFGTRCPVCIGETRIALSLSRPVVDQAASESHPEVGSIPKPALKKTEGNGGRGSNLAVLLDNIRSAWNVGSILRSADGFGFSHAYLCGITATGDHETVRKTSLGAEDSVPWSYHKDAVRLVQGLKKEGWKVYALEEDRRAVSLSPRHHRDAPAYQVLMVGNEITGVDPELLDLCDTIFFIPMRGQKRSFNVAIAFGIAAYALRVTQVESE